MKLLCVRHGHAEPVANVAGERSLSEQGRLEVSKVANYLAMRDSHISHVMCSPKLRTQQTAEILACKLTSDQSCECSDLLSPDKAVAPLVEQIRGWNDDTLLVGHMPFMPQLISLLVLGMENYNLVRFPPATVVCLERYEGHHWIVTWVLSPDLVPDKFM